ncbi:hypothetical protein GGF41_007192, partial [Coemansia sp. RSA 2531]
MSNHLSSAQALPIDIIRSILKWIVLEERSPFYGNSCDMYELQELLTVSSDWRQAALELLWRRLNLMINAKKGEVYLERPMWLKQKTLPPNAENLARDIRVRVSMSSIVSGIACKLLGNYIRDTKCFPLAYKLTVEITDFKDRHYDAKDIVLGNTLEFANKLRSIAPVTATLHMRWSDQYLQRITDSSRVRDMDEDVLKMLSNVLYASAKRAQLDLDGMDVANLSTISCIP